MMEEMIAVENVENVENVEKLAEQVRQIAYQLHVYLGNGLLEKVYENGLKHRLEKLGFKVESQKNLKVYDEDGFELGDYYADLVVNDVLLVELKATKAIGPEHLAQTLNYLKIIHMPLALIINFGSYQFETRKVYPPTQSPRSPRQTGDSHGEHEERVELLGDLGAGPISSPCSPRSPRLNTAPIPRSPRQTGDSHREHEERVELLGDLGAAPISSTRSPRSPWLNTAPISSTRSTGDHDETEEDQGSLQNSGYADKTATFCLEI